MNQNNLEQLANSNLSEEELLKIIREIREKQIKTQAVETVPQTVTVPEPVTLLDIPQTAAEANSDFDELKKLLQSNKWPQAVDTSLICNPNSEEDKLDRAEGIIDLLIDEPLKGKKFLDFGCGEGHIVFKAVPQECALSVGYDIKEFEKWKEFKSNKSTLTTDLNFVQSNAPYDIILLYDVIDHAKDNVLNTVSQLIAKNGKIYLRSHPFCSRHATHLYHQLNKAFLHLVFSEDELAQLGLMSTEYNAQVIYPIITYGKLIQESGLKILGSPNILRQKVEPFFKENPLISKRIQQKIATKTFPDFQCEQQFLDYVLTKG